VCFARDDLIRRQAAAGGAQSPDSRLGSVALTLAPPRCYGRPRPIATLAKDRRPAMRNRQRLVGILAAAAIALSYLGVPSHAWAQSVIKIAAGVPLTGPL